MRASIVLVVLCGALSVYGQATSTAVNASAFVPATCKNINGSAIRVREFQVLSSSLNSTTVLELIEANLVPEVVQKANPIELLGAAINATFFIEYEVFNQTNAAEGFATIDQVVANSTLNISVAPVSNHTGTVVFDYFNQRFCEGNNSVVSDDGLWLAFRNYQLVNVSGPSHITSVHDILAAFNSSFVPLLRAPSDFWEFIGINAGTNALFIDIFGRQVDAENSNALAAQFVASNSNLTNHVQLVEASVAQIVYDVVSPAVA
eukprot:TRINITY_DN20663_c0_g1_i1.p2 TRINITY_DN20663_c0_g1~~TRINITY_DN20663_c0_g1_i1.p2  ORF type:complete len:262 (-),score=116.07 TRINITY_DN20663_c0_g1_i1:64-849(-)